MPTPQQPASIVCSCILSERTAVILGQRQPFLRFSGGWGSKRIWPNAFMVVIGLLCSLGIQLLLKQGLQDACPVVYVAFRAAKQCKEHSKLLICKFSLRYPAQHPA
eukprot:2352681-Amphidinium_carterae.1